MSSSILFLCLALLAGMMIPFQSAMNARLGNALQSSFYSALTVFVVAAMGLLLYVVLSHSPVPSQAQFAAAPKWSYLGGVLGGTYILLIVICAPKLGIGNVTVVVLLGQIASALLIDQFGLLNFPVHALNWQRAIGMVLLIAGVYLVKKF